MINYIIQIALCQVLFLVVYDFFLQRETFFKWNRLYLIATPILSFITPLLKFDFFRESFSQEYLVLLPEIVLNPQSAIMSVENSAQSINYFNVLFYAGVVLFLIVFLIKLAKILNVILSHTIVKKDDYNLVLLEDKQSAFSFFNYIFIHKSFVENKDLNVLEHEKVHCKQKHTLDLLFFEILKIVMWFNPMIYIYQSRIKLLHEYISDEKVVKQTDKKSYFNRLLAETFNVENISFINQFYKHSFIKKRVMMITKEKSRRNKQLKYLLLVPVLLSMLFYVSCSETEQQTALLELETLERGVEKDISFAIIDQVPVFPGCTGNEAELKKCLSKSIQKHVAQNFKAQLHYLDGKKQKVYIQFKITKTGKIDIVGIRAPSQYLEDESRRVVSSLPIMTPGKHKGKIVNVLYMLPIEFLM